jgi:signal transduction histidine kinase
MERAEALKLLYSTSPHERLRAAQFFARNCSPTDLAALRKARDVESVAYVKRRLDAAIQRCVDADFVKPVDRPPEPDVPEALKREIRSQAAEAILGILLHEIEPRIGQIRAAAAREVPDFDNSMVKLHLEQLGRTFEGITGLRRAAATPKIEEFDLALLIADLIAQEVPNEEVQISVQGQQPFVIVSDPRLLSLAISNGLRNAIEAVQTLPKGGDKHAVIVTWGMTDVDYWIAIIDSGPGIVGPAEAAFEIGRTTKRGHSGFGLSITRQVMDTLDGSATLAPARGGGARLELRWDR